MPTARAVTVATHAWTILYTESKFLAFECRLWLVLIWSDLNHHCDRNMSSPWVASHPWFVGAQISSKLPCMLQLQSFPFQLADIPIALHPHVPIKCTALPYSGKLSREKLSWIGEQYDFRRENFRGLLAFAVPRTPHPKFREKNFRI